MTFPMPSRQPWPRLFLALLAVLAFTSAVGAQSANPLGAPASFAGKFAGDDVTVQLTKTADGYAGTLSVGQQDYPAKATPREGKLSGTFTASGASFDFSATLENDHLILVSGGRTRSLARVTANPLGDGHGVGNAPDSAVPANGVGNGSSLPVGTFSVLGTTDKGQTLFLKLSGAPALESAITQTADALGNVLDGKPTLNVAFGAAKARTRGGALLSGTMKGQQIRGWIFCGTPANGGAATACAVIASADAGPTDIQTLLSFMPAQMTMKEHAFPDGSGSVDLPTGWTTTDPTMTYGVRIAGPAGQLVVMGNFIQIRTPEGNFAQLAQKNYQMAMTMYENQMRAYQQSISRHQQFPNIPVMAEPQKPAPPDLSKLYPGTIFCPLCSGAQEVIQKLYPVSEKMSRAAGGIYTSIDNVIEIVPADPNPAIAGDKAGIAYMAVTDHNGDKITHCRVINRIETYPILDGKDSWTVVFNTMRAPDATFERDLPVMHEIMDSFKPNMDVISKRLNADGQVIRDMAEQNQRQLLKRSRDFNEQQARNFDRFEAQMRAQSQARHDAASDFIEYVSGARTIYDTQTGQSTQVDLFNSKAIVQSLNDALNSPNQIIEIPLRYQR